MGIRVVKRTPSNAKQKSYSNKDVKSTVKKSNVVLASPKTTSRKATSRSGNMSLASENRQRGKAVRKMQNRSGSKR